MGRVIDADAFDERVRLDVGLCEEELTEDFKDGISTVLEMMKTAPTVDAVPVLCKDCKHRDPEDRKCDCGHDIMWQLPRGDDWYCADGERKDGDDG